MTLRFAKIASLAAVLAAAGASLWARTQLPDAPIATHFDLQGHVNGQMARDTALAVGPGMALVIALIMLWFLPPLMPKKATLARSSEAYGASVIVTVLFLCLVHGLLIARALHYAVDTPKAILGAAGLLFVVIGNYLPKTRFNYLMGIRNPWTLCSEEVWDRTHRFSGPLFMLLGALIIVDAALVPFPMAFMLMTPAAVVVTLICVAYSYITAKRLNVA